MGMTFLGTHTNTWCAKKVQGVISLGGVHPEHDLVFRSYVGNEEKNAIESHATNIEVRFLKMGAEGFDVIDNGTGIHETEFSSLAKTLPNRE